MNESEMGTVPTDAEAAKLGFGTGGVPWFLMMLYLGFLVFFVWYVLEYQLPEFLDHGPVTPAAANEAALK